MASGRKKANGTAAENWPASRVELRSLVSIKEYENNPRAHPPAQVDLIAESMRTDGVTAAILVDEAGVIIYGHGRRLAALQNGYAEYPVCVALGWSEEKKRAVRIKDNSFGLLSSWDMVQLRHEAVALKTSGYDMPLLGFGETMTGWLTSGNLVTDIGGEWSGMPGFNQDDKTAFRSIVMHFKDQKAVDAFARLIGQKITPNTRFAWYPENEIETYVDKRYSAATK